MADLSGEYSQRWNGQLVYWRAGDLRGEHLLGLWLDLVFAAAAAPGKIRSAVIAGGKKKTEEYFFNAPDSAQAQAYVRRCMDYYMRAWQQPHNYLPGLHWSLVNGSAEEQTDIVVKQSMNEYSELNRESLQRCFPEFDQTLINGGLQPWRAEYDWIWQLPLTCLERGGDE